MKEWRRLGGVVVFPWTLQLAQTSLSVVVWSEIHTKGSGDVKLNQCLEGAEASPTCFKGQGLARQRWAEWAWPCLVVGS